MSVQTTTGRGFNQLCSTETAKENSSRDLDVDTRFFRQSHSAG
jgi:hypothetical protein